MAIQAYTTKKAACKPKRSSVLRQVSSARESELVADIHQEDETVLLGAWHGRQAARNWCAAVGFRTVRRMVPAELNPAQDVLPQIILHRCSRRKDLASAQYRGANRRQGIAGGILRTAMQAELLGRLVRG